MASYNKAERRFPNAVEGILASKGLAFDGQQPFEPEDFDDLDDDETQAPELTFIGEAAHNFKPANPVKRHFHGMVIGTQVIRSTRLKGLDLGVDYSLIRGLNNDAAKQKTSTYSSVGEEIARELSRLKRGWAGDESEAPSEAILSDLIKVTALLPADVLEPETEVDPDDGTVILRWIDETTKSSFSLTFLGRGEVGGFLLSPTQTPAWRLKISEAAQITAKFNSEGVLNVIKG